MAQKSLLVLKCNTGDDTTMVAGPTFAEGCIQIDIAGSSIVLSYTDTAALGKYITSRLSDSAPKTAKELGAAGGKKRAENLTKERREEIARNAAKARWTKDQK